MILNGEDCSLYWTGCPKKSTRGNGEDTPITVQPISIVLPTLLRFRWYYKVAQQKEPEVEITGSAME